MADLLLVEDHRDLARGLKANLELEGHAVTHCERGDRAMELLSGRVFDLVILDVMLPGADGIAVLRDMRRRGIATPVLMLTARGEELDMVNALRRGADDYVTKPFGLMELLARVEALLRRSGGRGPPPEQRIGPWTIRRASRQVLIGGREIPLAPKEYDLLLALADRPGEVLSRHELLSRVWGHSGEVATRTVDTHMAELRRKLEDDAARPRYLLTARGAGYWLRGGPG